MGKVRSFAYRRAPTARGIESIEKDQIKPYDVDIYANFNTGVLEQYLDEKYRVTSFRKKQWFWKKVLIGLVIGMLFTVINQYVGLRIGMIVGGNWYIVYLLGLALKWKPEEINISAGCSTGVSATCTGFVFTYPAIFLLAYAATEGGFERYLGKGGVPLIAESSIPPISLAITATIIAGFLGVLYFTIFRRIWLVEDPLPMPGFEGTVKMMDMSYDISRGAPGKAMQTLKKFAKWFGISFIFAFIRDLPLISEQASAAYVDNVGVRISLLDKLLLHNKWYLKGDVMQPYETDLYTSTHLGLSLSPMMFASGWFMRFRSSFILACGSFLAWLVIVPLAIYFQVPVFKPSADPLIEGYYAVSNIALYFNPYECVTPATVAHSKVAVPIGIGVILGGGITAILKMSHIFKTSVQDLFKTKGGERTDYVKGRGWYEWPTSHIPILMVITFLGVGLLFTLYGYPALPSFALSIVLVIVMLFISAIAVKTMGEIRSTPVSACSFITLLLLVGIFTAIGVDPKITIVMALLGTAVFGSAVTLSSDIIYDFKVGMYCGTKPYYLMKGELLGVIPGAIIAVVAATIFSIGLAKGALPLIAPQAHAFAGFSQALMGGVAPWNFIILGIFIGVFVELITGMGTSFGLGLYFPLPVSLTILVGGIMRDIWEKKWLEPKAKAEKWDDRTKTLKQIDTYIICIGLIVGEAILGTIVAIYFVIPLITGG
jgi:uncharacterized oligopeptide transporter (OPT) family protein